jgi:hypothetical protein
MFLLAIKKPQDIITGKLPAVFVANSQQYDMGRGVRNHSKQNEELKMGKSLYRIRACKGHAWTTRVK